MSAQVQNAIKRLSAPDIQGRKGQTPLGCLTAHSSAIAVLLDEVCDLILVGDSTGMVAHGMPDTIGVGVEMMILHGQAVVRSTQRAMIVVDLPFGAYEGPFEQAYENAVRILKGTGAQAVKVEAGPEIATTITYLTRRGIPVVGHVGLRPQAVRSDGGFKAKGKDSEERDSILAEARAAEAAGVFALVIREPLPKLSRSRPSALAHLLIAMVRSSSPRTFSDCSSGRPNSCAATPISAGSSKRQCKATRGMSATVRFLAAPKPTSTSAPFQQAEPGW